MYSREFRDIVGPTTKLTHSTRGSTARQHVAIGPASTTRATQLFACHARYRHRPPLDAASVKEEKVGSEESLPRVTAEMVDDWLRHAQLRAANLYYLAGDPSPTHRERALEEMTKALREALEEVRVVGEQLRRDAEVQQGRSRRPSASREQAILPSRPLERE